MFLDQHVSHLRDKSDNDLNKLLAMCVDVDTMFTAMNKEEDQDTRKVYMYLFRVSKHWSMGKTRYLNVTFDLLTFWYLFLTYDACLWHWIFAGDQIFELPRNVSQARGQFLLVIILRNWIWIKCVTFLQKVWVYQLRWSR